MSKNIHYTMKHNNLTIQYIYVCVTELEKKITSTLSLLRTITAIQKWGSNTFIASILTFNNLSANAIKIDNEIFAFTIATFLLTWN